MRVKIDKFCSLSTSPSWQAWLFHFDGELYKQFIKKLQESRGCNHNRDIMSETLKTINEMGGSDRLLEFLSSHYPHMLVNDEKLPVVAAMPEAGEIFENYHPGILTYPRRVIFTGANLQKQVKSFLVDKIKSDFVIVGDRAYVEYLTRDDRDIVDSIPQKNWRISAWRTRS
jgi:hypothetical protein